MNPMKTSPLLFSLLFLSAASVVQAAEVRIIDAQKAQQCLLVKEESCSSSTEEKCTEKLRKEALEVRADSILILDSSESRFRKPTLAGGIKTVNKVSLEAELYDCLQQEKPVAANQAKARKAEKKSIKERLEILQNLRDDELITEKEYSQKKAEILQDL
ncbi:MAG: hypothetical protein CMH95_07865 [Oceanospirillaceae bacterium]|uniref:hypothetical protein n=2 Tax=Oceanospirillaceae TaxID=135620 RepID=UPI000C66CB73|nr:hypothetical protein [Thalassolituus sp. UBA2590]MAG44187.1 hypothetical protein [Oceanospirillaceae bacterium]MEC8909098.1 hypothetical protein [Pseudomonadota bacterium]HCG80190.1 hypothetical protein [Oceanospirillales bacterium]MEE3191413.1 hypothetical protein [Pseudomonadota bacterium]MEE3208990.1 hypothetical protein [Pseudomonadota bacterium]|tara:strand:- start:64 stop:540 length:477 start_codon:yes stop_codon:yes gene_type:complete